MGFHPYNTTTLQNIALRINYKDLKPGDILDYPGVHVVLYSDGHTIGHWNIYEATPPKVRYHTFPYYYLNYTPYSIFPQFSDESPANGEVVEDSQTVNISLTIKASGNIASDGVSMSVNGVEVSNLILQSQKDNTWTLKSPNYDVSKGGRYNVHVTVRNDIAGNE